jgi:hypothetical protein
MAATSSLNVQAASPDDDRWFEVELLVFKRNVDIQKISEQLDQNNVYLKKRDRLEVFKAAQLTTCSLDNLCLHSQLPVQIGANDIIKGDHRIKLLDSSHLELIQQRRNLEANSLFTPLIHAAWRMPVQPEETALPIHLFAGKNYALDLYKDKILNGQKSDLASTKINTQKTTEKENDLDVLASLQKQKTIQDLYEIDGNLLIYVERYLFVDSQLVIRTETQKEVSIAPRSVLASKEDDANSEFIVQKPTIKPGVKTETAVTETLFDQKRRMRSEEIHYLDHPLFGIIIQIRKIPAKELAILESQNKVSITQ